MAKLSTQTEIIIDLGRPRESRERRDKEIEPLENNNSEEENQKSQYPFTNRN